MTLTVLEMCLGFDYNQVQMNEQSDDASSFNILNTWRCHLIDSPAFVLNLKTVLEQQV